MCCEIVVERSQALPASASAGCEHVHLSPEPRSVGQARQWVADRVGPVAPEVAEALALLTTELVTNGVLHARTPLEVGIIRHEAEILVSVGDGNAVPPEHQPYSEDRTGGRGMLLVREMSHRWGITSHEHGKSVWFTVVDNGSGGEGDR
ncbi:MAG TPA: ATP-binding protein [Acidimicrobiales bacterium]|nr:ATP-binding protein [Acidimicrobiales bacterium]